MKAKVAQKELVGFSEVLSSFQKIRLRRELAGILETKVGEGLEGWAPRPKGVAVVKVSKLKRHIVPVLEIFEIVLGGQSLEYTDVDMKLIRKFNQGVSQPLSELLENAFFDFLFKSGLNPKWVESDYREPLHVLREMVYESLPDEVMPYFGCLPENLSACLIYKACLEQSGRDDEARRVEIFLDLFKKGNYPAGLLGNGKFLVVVK